MCEVANTTTQPPEHYLTPTLAHSFMANITILDGVEYYEFATE